MNDPLLILLIIAVAGLAAVTLLRPQRPIAQPPVTPDTASLEAIARVEASVKGLVEQSNRDRQRIEDVLKTGNDESSGLLADVQKRIAVIDAAQANIATLQTQVNELVYTFSDKSRRGRFGEQTLEDLVTSILVKDSYAFQHVLSNGKQVDCLIRLGGEAGDVAIDAKFPLEAYELWLRAETDDGREVAKRAFTKAVKGHIDDIAAKYLIYGETREVAFMFVPADAIFGDLLMEFSEAVDHGYKKRVYLVSPNTLQAYLVGLRAIYVSTRVQEHWQTIRTMIEGREGILENIRRLDERVASLDHHFSLAQKDIDDITTSSAKVAKKGEAIRDAEFEAEILEAGQGELPDGTQD